MYTRYGCFLLVWLGSVLAEVTVCLDRTRDVVVVWPEPVILFRTAGVSRKAAESCTETTNKQVEQLSSSCLHQSDPCASFHDIILHCDLVIKSLWEPFGPILVKIINSTNAELSLWYLVYLSVFHVGTESSEVLLFIRVLNIWHIHPIIKTV